MAAGRAEGTGRSGPTLEQVAARAGVGRGTASRVINGSPRVSPRARAAVEAAVAELGYVPHRAARALAAGSADTLALVVPEQENRLFAEPYFSEILRGVSSELADTDMQLLLTLIRDERSRDRFARYAAARRVDGVLLVSVHGDDPLPELLRDAGVPAVLSGRRSADERVPHVDSDNVVGAQIAVEHLLGRGRRKVATITGPPDMYAARCRLEGYREALRAATRTEGGPDERLIAQGDFTEEGGRRAMLRLLERDPWVDAVFCASDVMAAGARLALREAGRKVPEDVALVGFDDSAVARHMDPPLTTVRQPIEEMGRAMVRMLRRLMPGEDGPPDGARAKGRAKGGGADAADEDGTRLVLPTELIRRSSS
ncbi:MULTISPECIES: LacI family DNA-binding transcriptional regulator [Streptomyces]|uniref:LacI family transcriptional regulator n=1 Tax=Streptomyces cacaoi TaxID=1898 RepID=A0A4Y3QV51_STRCI|nr:MULTISPECIES: LacI family DNA-binding transcriptional regulator [Streptomyces]NNG84433.1 LacI family transcriptional regulator [Streptomyces cacaoi]GEB48557.1 LacI family transcriptional regulator [Streptomyces cacaoi]